MFLVNNRNTKTICEIFQTREISRTVTKVYELTNTTVLTQKESSRAILEKSFQDLGNKK